MSAANYSRPGGPDLQNEMEALIRRRSVERRDLAARARLVQRVVSEFREMPCLRLTAAQAQRLFGLREDICMRLVDELIRDGILRKDEEGRYAVVEGS
jgi:hypothetical protein